MDETISSSTLKDFEILKTIGKGSYGTVYKVRKRLDQGVYAMKTINISMMDKKTLTNTLNELRILCSIDHPNVVGYKEAFIEKEGKELCVVMEFVGGGDMEAKIKECKNKKLAISEDIIWNYACQVLLGLKALHDMKIIHRDIKSANLFLSEDFKTIKLGDLNVAKVAKDNLASTQIGTPYYLAPEIWQNKIYDYKCDIFSLGCVLYEMASLKVPFEANSIQDLYKKITRGMIERIPSRYSEDLYNCIKLFLTKEPKKRPGVKDIFLMPIFAKKIEELNGFDLVKDKDKVDKLMDTIIVPLNLGQLKNRLPKKLVRSQSCKNRDEGLRESQEKLKNNVGNLVTNLRFNKENSAKLDAPKSKIEAPDPNLKLEEKNAPLSIKKTKKLPPIKNANKLPPVKQPFNRKVPTIQKDNSAQKESVNKSKNNNRIIIQQNSKVDMNYIKQKDENANKAKIKNKRDHNKPRVSSADPFAKHHAGEDSNYRPLWWG